MALKLKIFLLQAVEIYSYILLIWVIGSWFPRFTITKFYRTVEKIVYPYASIFRSIIPPLGGFDFSVILAFMFLNTVVPIVINFLWAFIAPMGV